MMVQHDTSGIEAKWTATTQGLASILSYTQAVQAITLGPQPLVIDGQTAGSWDPLSSTPAAETALQAAQQHCVDFNNNVVEGLACFPIFFSSVVGPPGIAGDSTTIANVMSQLSPGVAPTAAQRQTVSAALADIVSNTNSVQSLLNGIKGSATTFQDEISTDVQALSTGSQSVATAITQLQEAYKNAVIEYGAEPGGSAIVTILGTITSQMNSSLNAIQLAINNAISDEGAVVPALTQLQDVFIGLSGDYATFSQEATAASDADFGSFLQQLDVSVLQQYWSDTLAFMTAHGVAS